MEETKDPNSSTNSNILVSITVILAVIFTLAGVFLILNNPNDNASPTSEIIQEDDDSNQFEEQPECEELVYGFDYATFEYNICDIKVDSEQVGNQNSNIVNLSFGEEVFSIEYSQIESGVVAGNVKKYCSNDYEVLEEGELVVLSANDNAEENETALSRHKNAVIRINSITQESIQSNRLSPEQATKISYFSEGSLYNDEFCAQPVNGMFRKEVIEGGEHEHAPDQNDVYHVISIQLQQNASEELIQIADQIARSVSWSF